MPATRSPFPALAIDPDLHDAWFGIGIYRYYAAVAPAAAADPPTVATPSGRTP